jgi:hypothetical protein
MDNIRLARVSIVVRREDSVLRGSLGIKILSGRLGVKTIRSLKKNLSREDARHGKFKLN